MYLLYFDHNDDSYSRKWMRKINFFTQAILRTLPSRFCAPYPVDFAHHFYLYFTIIYACYDALMPIKLFDYAIQLTFFLHKPIYSCYKLQIPKFTNY